MDWYQMAKITMRGYLVILGVGLLLVLVILFAQIYG